MNKKSVIAELNEIKRLVDSIIETDPKKKYEETLLTSNGIVSLTGTGSEKINSLATVILENELPYLEELLGIQAEV